MKRILTLLAVLLLTACPLGGAAAVGPETPSRPLPSAVGAVRGEDSVEIVFADGTVYDTGSKKITTLPTESALVGAAQSGYMTVLAEENGTLWIRKAEEDFAPVRYGELYGCPVRLTDTAVWEDTVYICGEKEDGSPLLAGSVLGGVWIEREIAVYEDNGTVTLPEGTPLCLTAAEELEALVLGFSDGMLAVLPACVKCSAFYRIADGAVTEIAAADGVLRYFADGELRTVPLDEIPLGENPEQDCPAGC